MISKCQFCCLDKSVEILDNLWSIVFSESHVKDPIQEYSSYNYLLLPKLKTSS